jgi:uncharacterized protein
VSWYATTADGLSVDVLVQPRSSRERLGPIHGDRLKVAVNAPPVDGEANAAVIALLAKTLGLRRADVEITAGLTGRRKTVRLRGLSAEALLSKVDS